MLYPVHRVLHNREIVASLLWHRHPASAGVGCREDRLSNSLAQAEATALENSFVERGVFQYRQSPGKRTHD